MCASHLIKQPHMLYMSTKLNRQTHCPYMVIVYIYYKSDLHKVHKNVALKVQY